MPFSAPLCPLLCELLSFRQYADTYEMVNYER